MKLNSFERKTRAIFHELHKKQVDSRKIFNRLKDLLNPSYLKESDDFFKGKICLDAGCGSNASATYSMLEHGAGKVYAFDLDETIFETAPNCLRDFEGKYTITTDNVLKMQFDDNFFDFVHCAGVLHHTEDVFTGLKELARVTKKEGTLYVMTYGKGGLIRDITSFLRDKYLQDEDFKTLIDSLNTDFFYDFFSEIFTIMIKNNDSFGNQIPMEIIKSLFDEDLVLTIKDRITAPVYHEHSEEELVLFLNNSGFSKIERLERFPTYTNVRRFLSPLYYKYDSKFSKILYGSGNIQLKASNKIL